MTEKNSPPVNIQICFRAVLSPAFFENQSRMKRKISSRERVQSLERSFRDLVEKLIRRFPQDLVLSISTDIHREGASNSPADALVSKLQILRPMENVKKHDWRRLKRACRIALFELGPSASPDRVHSRIQCRGSHNFHGTDSPMSAVLQALTAIRHGAPESSVERAPKEQRF